MAQLQIKKILIPTDFSEDSTKAFDHAILLAKITNADVVLLHVMEDLMATAATGRQLMDSVDSIQKLETQTLNFRTEQMNEIVIKMTQDNALNVIPMIVIGRTHIEILKAVEKTNADLIIMGTHGVSGFREFIMGSNTYSVVRDSTCPVISLQKKTPSSGFKNMLVPFSDREHSREKIIYAIKIAELYGATLHILGIDVENSEEHRDKIQHEANQIKTIIDKHGLNCTLKVLSSAYNSDTVLSYANVINADLIVAMGNTDKQNFAEYFSGSFSQQIINHSTLPVLSIHASFNPDLVELWHGI